MTTSAAELLGAAHSALMAGDLDTADRLGRELVELGETGAGHEVLGSRLYVDDELDDARHHLEQAFRAHRDAGDACAAARCAILLAGLLATGSYGSVASRGWLERARRLLETVGPCVEWGQWELAVMACDRPDARDLLDATERALAIAREHGDTDLEVQALADGGLALVTMGHTRDGFARLDEALAAISAGEVSPVVAGVCMCSMLTACDRAQDVRRATEWCQMVRHVVDATGDRPRALRTHCRVVYGAVLSASGRWDEAEALMLDALGPPDDPAVSHHDLTSAHLAQLRLDQGRVEEAAALLAPYEDRVVAAGPLARVHLEQGAPDLAAAVLRRALTELVDDALRMLPLQSLLVQAELARGDLEAADAACEELEATARAVDLPVQRAEAAIGRARLARAAGESDDALRHYGDAAALVGDGIRPVLTATIHLEVAEVQAGRDDRAAAVVAARAALAACDRLGSNVTRDRAASLLRDLGAAPARSGASSGVPGDLTQRERDVLALLGAGLTNAQIGERLYISAKTVEHHVGRLLAKLGVSRRTEAAAIAARSGLTAAADGASTGPSAVGGSE